MNTNKKAFTIAETVILLVVIGTIVVLSIPSIVNNHLKSTNKIKLKKAMESYSFILQTMVTENHINSNSKMRIWADTEQNNCANTSVYFKIREGADCRFKTTDNIWWDISDIENPIIILDKKLKNENIVTLREYAARNIEANGKKYYVYGFVGRFDDATRTIHINDKMYEETNGLGNNILYMRKLYSDIGLVNYDVASTETNPEPVVEEVQREYDENGNLRQGWDSDCGKYYVDGVVTNYKYCKKGKPYNATEWTPAEYGDNTWYGKKYRKGTLVSIEYHSDNDHPEEVIQFKEDGNISYIGKNEYYSNGLAKSIHWYDSEGNSTYTEIQYYDEDTGNYYLAQIALENKDNQNIIIRKSDQPWKYSSGDNNIRKNSGKTSNLPRWKLSNLGSCSENTAEFCNVYNLMLEKGMFDDEPKPYTPLTILDTQKTSEYLIR